MLEFSNLRDLTWNDLEQTRATGIVDIEGIGTTLPYTFDIIEHEDIITALRSGDLGEVAPFDAQQQEADAAAAARKAEFPNLEPDQFWGVLRATGYEQPLRAWIAGIEDPVQRAFVSAKLEFAKYFERDHPLIEDAGLALGIAETELDDLWQYGAS